MSNEELMQRGYLQDSHLRGEPYGDYEFFQLGSTTVDELVSSGLKALVPEAVDYEFRRYRPSKRPGLAKPDQVFVRRYNGTLNPVAVREYKRPTKLRTERDQEYAAEQALHAALSLGVRIAITSDGRTDRYIDVEASSLHHRVQSFDEQRSLNPGVLDNLLRGDAGVAKDPKPLAETVWQIIWHATKAEPKECLLTFVEIFVLKFLSDNLSNTVLPSAYSFYNLLGDPAEFERRHGKKAIEYYVSDIRPHIKTLFPDNVVSGDPDVARTFGLRTVVSKASIINGFAFLRSSTDTLASFNRTFLEILEAFQEFGPLTAIDPEFKLRLYETFLRRSARQERLGQFFTPRNIVRSMVKMAQLGSLPTGATVLDPAAGVGGFILEPLLFSDALPGNIRFEGGKAIRKVRTIGADVDVNLHILAKANMLLHLAEDLRDPATSLQALNQAMADTFVLMNENETLGSLLNPPRDAVDVVLTNPPYVTQGSAIYKREIREVKGPRNGLDLRDYYEGAGLGLESLFVRYISGSLKPGGQAFVIVPMGLLNRTEPGPKARLLEECNIVGSIQLPRNAFFNTPQPTYILVLERRYTPMDGRPPVFCGIARTTGETLDWQRFPTPDENDLMDIAGYFTKMQSDADEAPASALVKIVDAKEFSESDRWDVMRFWADDELINLGVRRATVDRHSFIEETTEALRTLLQDLHTADEELRSLSEGPQASVPLADESLFEVRSGTRITQYAD